MCQNKVLILAPFRLALKLKVGGGKCGLLLHKLSTLDMGKSI